MIVSPSLERILDAYINALNSLVREDAFLRLLYLFLSLSVVFDMQHQYIWRHGGHAKTRDAKIRDAKIFGSANYS